MSIKLENQVLPSHTAIEKVVWTKPHTLQNKVVAFQTTRLPPLSFSAMSSKAPYNSFNLGLHVEDVATTVKQNRDALLSFLPENTSIQWLDQVHGNHVHEVTKVSTQAVVADAAISRQKHSALAIMTADCLPILLSDEQGEVIAAIHGGWRPLASAIIENTIDKMQITPSKVFAWLGPCIGPNKFEIGKEVKIKFCEQSPFLEAAFTPKSQDESQDKNQPEKYLANLQMIASLQLKSLGVQQIHSLPECTYSLGDKYYSYRSEPVTGRMASIICLK